MMTVWRYIRAAMLLAFFVLQCGCGQTFRPIAIPQAQKPPDPSSFHFALVISANGTDCSVLCDAGSSTQIDVSGDSNVGVATVGFGPVHAALLPNSSKIYIANSLEDTVSEYVPLNATIVATISLSAANSPRAVPVFIHTMEN